MEHSASKVFLTVVLLNPLPSICDLIKRGNIFRLLLLFMFKPPNRFLNSDILIPGQRN